MQIQYIKIHFYFGKESIMLGSLSMFGLHILGLLIWKYYLQVEWLNNECWNGKVTKNIKSWEIFLTVGCLKLDSLRVFNWKYIYFTLETCDGWNELKYQSITLSMFHWVMVWLINIFYIKFVMWYHNMMSNIWEYYSVWLLFWNVLFL